MANYSWYVPPEEGKVIEFADQLKDDKVLSSRITFIVKMYLENNPDPIESEISYYNDKIKRLKETKEKNGYNILPELKELRTEVLERFKDLGQGATMGWLGGPDNKKLLKKNGYTPERFYEEIMEAIE